MSIGAVSGGMSMFNSSSMQRPQKISEEVQEKIFTSSDADDSNGLSESEFAKYNETMEAAMGMSGSSMFDADKMFEKFDADGDGEVTAKEIEEGREKMIAELENKFGGDDQMSTMEQVNNILSQTQNTLMDMMGGNGSDDDEDNTFSFLSNEWSAKIQEYLDQSAKGNNTDAAGIQNMLNSGSISELI